MCRYSRISQYFKEPENLLRCSQKLSNGPYPEPDHASPNHSIISLQDPISILSTHWRLGFLAGLLHFGFSTSRLYAFLFCLICVACPAYPIILDLIFLIILGKSSCYDAPYYIVSSTSFHFIPLWPKSCQRPVLKHPLILPFPFVKNHPSFPLRPVI